MGARFVRAVAAEAFFVDVARGVHVYKEGEGKWRHLLFESVPLVWDGYGPPVAVWQENSDSAGRGQG